MSSTPIPPPTPADRARVCCRHAAALVHASVQPGGVRGGGVPALARGRDGRVPRQGRGAVPGECPCPRAHAWPRRCTISLICDVSCLQVNTWLTWLQQQESEEEEGED